MTRQEAVIYSFTNNIFANVKFHGKWWKLIGNIYNVIAKNTTVIQPPLKPDFVDIRWYKLYNRYYYLYNRWYESKLNRTCWVKCLRKNVDIWILLKRGSLFYWGTWISYQFSSVLFSQSKLPGKNTYKNCKLAREPRRKQKAYEACMGSPVTKK